MEGAIGTTGKVKAVQVLLSLCLVKKDDEKEANLSIIQERNIVLMVECHSLLYQFEDLEDEMMSFQEKQDVTCGQLHLWKEWVNQLPITLNDCTKTIEIWRNTWKTGRLITSWMWMSWPSRNSSSNFCVKICAPWLKSLLLLFGRRTEWQGCKKRFSQSARPADVAMQCLRGSNYTHVPKVEPAVSSRGNKGCFCSSTTSTPFSLWSGCPEVLQWWRMQGGNQPSQF